MTRSAKMYGCTYQEAFAVMLYRSKESGLEELIWNSRDGVTPFGIRMRDGTEGVHVEWNQDRFSPNHTPKVGDRIFVNLTLETARVMRRAFVEKYWDGSETLPPMSGMYESKESAIEQLAKSDFESFGAGTTPHLVEVDAALLADILSRRMPFVPMKFA